MRVWRIASARFPVLDGEGARLFGGRWNSIGSPVVYTAEHASLAVLETLVWTDPEDVPDDLLLYEIEVPKDASVDRLNADGLPADWKEAGAAVCVRLGDEWLASMRSLVLLVPSSIMDRDSNVLLNPRHPEARSVRVVRAEPFAFDLRLLS